MDLAKTDLKKNWRFRELKNFLVPLTTCAHYRACGAMVFQRCPETEIEKYPSKIPSPTLNTPHSMVPKIDGISLLNHGFLGDVEY